MKKLVNKQTFAAMLGVLWGSCISLGSHGSVDWVSVTLDNDVFLGDDSGYTNGIYLSTFDIGVGVDKIPAADFWVKPLLWSLPKDSAVGAINAYTFGQAMNTPSDLSLEIPGENELPYSAFLFLSNSYVLVGEEYADEVNTIIGLIGPAALGDEVQTFVHQITGSDEPRGWDNQLDNELVFQFSRARIRRAWVSGSGNSDLLLHARGSIGTLESGLSGGVMYRYGRGLPLSYVAPIFNSSRTANPAAIDGGWYAYVGARAAYTFNLVFADGNTFRDSGSIDYDQESIGVTMGFAYSWRNCSLTFAVNNANIIQTGEESEAIENLTEFGTITFAWRR